MKAVEKCGYEHPTPIQEQAIPIILEGRDLIGASQTGTGKTAAFALPLLTRIQPIGKPQILVRLYSKQNRRDNVKIDKNQGTGRPGGGILCRIR